MKALKSAVICVFVLILILPLVFFNFEKDAISEIDNRKLTELTFPSNVDKTTHLENYFNDRIGFRDKIITAYTVLNDKLFGKMTHPSYTYGKDGYVFGSGITIGDNFSDYHVTFANMVKSIQNYCQERNVPFIFVFNPAKPAVYQDKIASGINYNRSWVDKFFNELDIRGVNYIDNTVTLKELRDSGVDGFNVKYDANHWNAVGAFYGTNKVLQTLKDMNVNIHVNSADEFEVSSEHKDTLLVSNFPIDEDVPVYSTKNPTHAYLTNEYSSINLDSRYMGFQYFVNQKRKDEGSCKCLVFQGSYMNNYGMSFFVNAMGEYILVHDYQNVIDFPYYYNIFKPECVVFEVAEYTFNDTYFEQESMEKINYNPVLFNTNYQTVSVDLNNLKVVSQDKTLTTIEYITTANHDYVWLETCEIFDMKKSENGYQVTIETAKFTDVATAKVYVL